MNHQALVNKWKRKLFLNEWNIETREASHNSVDEDGSQTLADINVDIVYLNALITIYPCFYKSSKESQEQAIVHELCHIITQEAYDNMHYLLNGKLITPSAQELTIEKMTQRIANAILNCSK